MKKRLLLPAVLVLLLLPACAEEPAAQRDIAGTYQSTSWILDQADARCEKMVLILREDGRFLLRRCTIKFQPEKSRREAAWEGRYDWKEPSLTLHCGRTEYRLLYWDGKLYWSALEKCS